MLKKLSLFFILIIVIILPTLQTDHSVLAETLNDHGHLLIIDNETTKEDLYETFKILSDNDGELSVEDVASGKYDELFVIPEDFPVNAGFFHIGKWLKFDINNQSKKDDWLIEFAFPLIFTIDIYTENEAGIKQVTSSGAKYPFENRLFDHRHFIYELDVKQGEQKSFYIFIEGGADLHPPIKIWDKDEFIKFSNKEMAFIGLFYGMIFIMILYNAFLFIATRMKSYLFYVLAISATTMGQMSLNGLGFKYLWPNFPDWNMIAVPFWVSVSCILILFFTREFLNTKKYVPIFRKIMIGLMTLNTLTIVTLFFYHYIALNMMFAVSFLTFFAVICVAVFSLYKGVREARFFLVGWVVFLTGVFITILERASILPYSLFTEYAGQGALVVEVVLLSIALADKINMMRQEKSNAEKLARENQQLAIDNLKKADELKNEFLAITSHELRTPLYGMIGIAESLKEGIGGELSSEVQKQLDIIILSGHRLTHIINDILNFSKLKHHQVRIYPEQVNLKQLSSVVFAICQPLVNENEVTLINDIPDNLPDVLADQNRLQQILYNLIGNAIKFTQYGEIRVSAHIENDKVLIQISDTGKGMEAEELNRIFDPFTQGDDAHSRRFAGTGIGLNVTKRLVELHNSELKVESQIGEGSVFSFTLPLAGRRLEKAKKPIDVMKAMMAKDTALIKPKQLQKQTGPKVLVADDEKVNLQVLINQLSIEGFDVVAVTNGIEVLQEVESQSFDVVILDIMMPKVSGFDVCERLRKSHSLLELPILMLTAKDQLQDKIIAFEAGANDYLTKPCHRDELISRVRTLVNLKWMNEELAMLNAELEEKVSQRTKALQISNQELSITNLRLVETEQSRRNLLANVAHELGTPVTLIHSYVQSLQEGTITSDDEYFRNLVDDKIKVLDRLITDLSDLSRLEEGQASFNFATYDLYKWLEKVYQKLVFDVETLGRKITIQEIPFTKNMYESSLDTERMDQVFVNIISNAVKITSAENGQIDVMVDIDEDKSVVNIAISDNGKGIDQAIIPHIFDRFYKEKYRAISNSREGGTGLGLAIVKEIIQGHHGDIWVESEEEIGSTFYISLPIKIVYKKLTQLVH